MSQTLEDFLAGGAKSASFKDVKVGHSYTGTICSEPRVTQQRDFDTNELLFWDDESPKMQLIVEVQTELEEDARDDGVRAIYIKGQSQAALKKAIRLAGAKTIEIGGELTITWVSTAEPKRRGIQGAKQYEIEYAPPPSKGAQKAQAFLAEDDPATGSEAAAPKKAPAKKIAVKKATGAEPQDLEAIAAAKRQALIDAGFDPDDL